MGGVMVQVGHWKVRTTGAGAGAWTGPEEGEPTETE